MMVDEFGKIGLGQGFRIMTGSLELIGAIAVLVPRSSVFGAILMLMVDLGAFVAQLFVLHGDIIHTIVIGLVIGTLIFLQRRKLPMGAYRPANQL